MPRDATWPPQAAAGSDLIGTNLIDQLAAAIDNRTVARPC